MTDILTSVAHKEKALRYLAKAARQTTDQNTEVRIAEAVVLALFDASKSIRDFAGSVLSDIGPASIEVILDQTLWKIPGRTHGYDIAEKIFIEMGAPAIPILLDNIDKDVCIITNAICGMPFTIVKQACIQLFQQERFSDRYREEIYLKMRYDEHRSIRYGGADWDRSELEALLLSSLEHKDPLVRVLAAEWLADTYPGKALSTLEVLLKDEEKVKRFHEDFSKKGWTVSQYVEKALREARLIRHFQENNHPKGYGGTGSIRTNHFSKPGRR